MGRAERWAKKGKELDKKLSFDKVEYLDLKPGQNILRIVPPHGDDEDDDFWKEVIVSYNVGPNEKMIKRPDQYGKPDPVADEIAKLRKLGDEANGFTDHGEADTMRDAVEALFTAATLRDRGRGCRGGVGGPGRGGG